MKNILSCINIFEEVLLIISVVLSHSLKLNFNMQIGQ